jgi:putative MATE family efflux protein
MDQSHSISSNPKSGEKNNITKGVEILLGNPKQAIIKLAWPMIIAMSVNTIYNVVDAFWVSGLGRNALAAVGFFFPFFFMAMAIGVGLGVGGGSAVSRKIGADDKKRADQVAVQTLAFMVIISIFFTIPFFIFAEQIFVLIGAGDTAGMAATYGRIMFAGTIVIFFTQIANALLRSEGDANRAMYAMMLGAGLNLVLDPIFIYTFRLGVAGAAWATMLSLSISAMIMYYWLFIKKDTYLSFNFKNFKFDSEITKDISKVGLPASIMQLSMAFTMFITNIIIVYITDSTDGVAVYTTGWRIATIAILPLLGLATAVVSVTGAAYGQKDYGKLNTAYMYAIKIGLIVEFIIAGLIFIFAEQIALVFTQAEDAVSIRDDLIIFFQIICLFFPGAVLGIFSSSMFQGIGQGNKALIATLVRTIVLTIPLTILFGAMLNMDLVGVWLGISIANLTGSSIVFIWGRYYVNHLNNKKS